MPLPKHEFIPRIHSGFSLKKLKYGLEVVIIANIRVYVTNVNQSFPVLLATSCHYTTCVPSVTYRSAVKSVG